MRDRAHLLQIHFQNSERGKWGELAIIVQPFLLQLSKYRDAIMELIGLTLTIRKEKFGNGHGIV